MRNFYDKGFRVACIEQPSGGFGLCVLTLVARDGESWKVRASAGRAPAVGSDIRVRLLGTRNERNWSSHGFELAEALPRMPKQAIRAIYH